MKALLKQSLAAAGLVVQRLPRGVPSGHLLDRDLRLVLGPRTGQVCLDVGANRGGFVDLLCRLLPAPEIHAFEPAPGPFGQLQQRHGVNPAIHLTAAGVGDAPGELTLQIFDNETLNSFLPLAPGARETFGGPRPLREQTVPVVTLDDYAARHQLKEISLLKIDTQGYELHVLRGAAALLRADRIGAVLLELNFMALYQGQAAAPEIIRLLQDHGLPLVDFYEKCRQGSHLGWCTALFTRRAIA
jgi:FkbM family methyltransferase